MQAMLMAIPDKTDDEAVQQWIDRRTNDPDGLFRVIAGDATHAALGFIQVSQINHRNRNGYGAVAVSKRATLPGIGQIAMRELMRAACCDLGLTKLIAEIRADNIAAIQMNLMSGYCVVGTLEQHFADARGKRHDVLLLEKQLDPDKFKRNRIQ
jgi:RimJ/RimL family protein N-acetyltransferase